MISNEKLRKEIGSRIRSVRKNANMNQHDFSRSINISTNFLSMIECGTRGFSAEVLYMISTKYGVSTDYLMFGKDNANNM